MRIETRFELGQPVLYDGGEHVISEVRVRVHGEGAACEYYGIVGADGQTYSSQWLVESAYLKPIHVPEPGPMDVLTGIVDGRKQMIVNSHTLYGDHMGWWSPRLPGVFATWEQALVAAARGDRR